MKRSSCAVSLLILSALLFGGCGSSDSSPTPAEEPPVIITTISQVSFIDTVSATDVVAYGDYLYYVGYLPGASFGIVDFRDPRNPSILPTSTMNVGEAWGVAFDGRYAYVETDGGGEGSFSAPTLGVIDCLDPHNPVEVTANADSYASAYDVEISDNYLYNLSDSKIGVYDISTPGELKFLRNLETSGGTEFGKPLGDYLYVTDINGLLIFDISNPAAGNPVAGNFPIPSPGSGATATGTIAFVAGEEGGVPYIYAIDVSSPTNPTFLSRITTPSKLQFEMRILGNYLLANGYDHFAVIDISDPADMWVVDSVELDFGWGGFAVSGRHAIVSDNTQFRIIELF